jgi:hypothetical protein
MFATIASILIVVWLYKSAVNAKKNPWPLTGAGIVLFYITMQLCSTLILKPIMGKSVVGHTIHDDGVAMAIEISSIVVGIIVLALVRTRYLAGDQ